MVASSLEAHDHTLLLEVLDRELGSHLLVSSRVGVQTIPGVKLGQQLISFANQASKVNSMVKSTIVQDELIDGNPRHLPLWSIVLVPEHLGNGGSNASHASLLDITSDLLIRCHEAGLDLLLSGGIGGRWTNIVYAFEDNDELGAGLLESVALVALEKRRSETTLENGVASCGHVVDGYVLHS